VAARLPLRHVRQLDQVCGEVLASAWAAGAGPGDGPLTVDVDSTICEVHGYHKQGGKTDFSFNAVAYIAIGGEREFAEAVAHHKRYYPVLPVPVEQAIHHGPIGKIKDTVAEYAACGLDLLVLLPEVRSLQQLELLSGMFCPSTGTDAYPAWREVHGRLTIPTRSAWAELIRR
jgi:hypothetical protein